MSCNGHGGFNGGYTCVLTPSRGIERPLELAEALGELEGAADTGLPRVSMPFLSVGVDDSGHALVLRADPTAEP